MYTATLIVLDYRVGDVLFVRLTEEMTKSLEEEYENDSEEWLANSGLDEQFGFDISNSNWMLVDELPNIFYCYPGKNQKVQMFPVM